MWHTTTLSPDADFSYLRLGARLADGRLPFMFIPINTASYSDLPPEKTNAASALINVARNLGGSFGVSLANAELAQRAQFHHVRLAEHVSSSRLNTRTPLRGSRLLCRPRGLSNECPAAGDRLDRTDVDNQSMLLGYIDVFWTYAFFAACMIPIALLLRRVDLGGNHAAA